MSRNNPVLSRPTLSSNLLGLQPYHYILIALSILLFLSAVASMRWRMEHDAPVLFYLARLMDQHGFVPYKDFFEVNMPGTYFLYMLVGRAIGYVDDLKYRVVDLVYLGAILALTWLWLRKLGRDVAWGAVVLFGLFYLGSGYIVIMQREYFALLLVLTAVLVATSFPRLNEIVRGSLIGLLFGMIASIKPHLAISFPVVLLAQYLEFKQRKNGQVLTGTRLVLAIIAPIVCFAIPIFATIIYLIGSGAWPYFMDIAINYWPLYGGITRDLAIVRGSERLTYLVTTYLEFDGQIIWFMPAIAGILIATHSASIVPAQKRQLILMVGLAVSYSIYPMLTGQFFRYHWLPFMYFLLALGSLCLLEQTQPMRQVTKWIPAIILFVSVLCRSDFLFVQMEDLRRFVMREPMPQFRAGRVDGIANYLQEHLQAGDEVQALDFGNSALHAMLLADAVTATPIVSDVVVFHDVSNPYVAGLRKQFIQDLTDAQPRYIVEPVGNPFLQLGPYTTHEFLELRYWMTANYSSVYIGTEYEIYERVRTKEPTAQRMLIIYPPGRPVPETDWFSETARLDILALPDTVQLDAERVTSQLSDVSTNYQLMTFVFFDEVGTDPQRLLDQWATRHLFKLSEWWVFGGRVVDYFVGTPECFNSTSKKTTFGDVVVLDSASEAIVEAGSDRFVCIRLLWQAKSQIDRSYKVAAHIINESGKVIAQYDSVPVSYLAPTNTWLPGQTIIDQFGIQLPDDISAGRYEVHVIVYDEASGERLSLSDPGDSQESFLIGEVSITD